MTMMKLRRYLRGSGRVLAFVFAASVVWLLFDMAALRISLNDANSQLLKERSMREQAHTRRPPRRSFQNPLQKVAPARRAPPRVAEVYRQGAARKVEKVQRAEPRQTEKVLSGHQRGDAAKYLPPAVVKLDQKEVKLEGSKATPAAPKETLKTKQGVAKTQAVLQRSEKLRVGAQGVTQEGRPHANRTHPVQTTSQPSNKDVRGQQDAQVEQPKLKEPPAVQENATSPGRKTSVHKVLTLDATLAPRNPAAVGQFGRAAFAASSEDAQVRKRWDEGYFNVYLSDKIPIDRALPDTRPDS